jgi:hypothetical protein
MAAEKKSISVRFAVAVKFHIDGLIMSGIGFVVYGTLSPEARFKKLVLVYSVFLVGLFIFSVIYSTYTGNLEFWRKNK